MKKSQNIMTIIVGNTFGQKKLNKKQVLLKERKEHFLKEVSNKRKVGVN